VSGGVLLGDEPLPDGEVIHRLRFLFPQISHWRLTRRDDWPVGGGVRIGGEIVVDGDADDRDSVWRCLVSETERVSAASGVPIDVRCVVVRRVGAAGVADDAMWRLVGDRMYCGG